MGVLFFEKKRITLVASTCVGSVGKLEFSDLGLEEISIRRERGGMEELGGSGG